MIKRLSIHWLTALLFLLVLALGVAAAGRLTAKAVQAAPQPAGPATFVCTPFDVGVFDQRVHVRCTTAANVNGNFVLWWAYPTTDSAGASRFLSLFETAKATSQTVTIYYTPGDLSGSTFGCGNSDCHRIWGATAP